MDKIRKQIVTLGQYIEDVKNEKICANQECQRLVGQWTSNMNNELIFTVLSDNYVPPIIIGEQSNQGIRKQWIIDGLQRTHAFKQFKEGYKITRSIDEQVISYQAMVLDKNQKPMRNCQGEIVWETRSFDIKNKRYKDLPEELKNRFNGYQLELVIHQNCNTNEISRLVRKYNNHKAMNSAQKAFTYIDEFAKEIRYVSNNRFFEDVFLGNKRDKINGTIERLVGDMVIMCNYPEHYRKDTKSSFRWLNQNARQSDFCSLNELLTLIVNELKTTDEIRTLFNKKNAHIVVAIIKKFVRRQGNTNDINDFMEWLITCGLYLRYEGKNWREWDLDRSTRDSATVYGKLKYLTCVMNQYMGE